MSKFRSFAATDKAVEQLQDDVAALKDCLETTLTWMAQSANSPFSVKDVKELLKKMPRQS